jgi:hypothetical protein
MWSFGNHGKVVASVLNPWGAVACEESLQFECDYKIWPKSCVRENWEIWNLWFVVVGVRERKEFESVPFFYFAELCWNETSHKACGEAYMHSRWGVGIRKQEYVSGSVTHG